MTQNLPIGAVTSPHAVRIRHRPRRRLPRLRLHVALGAAGALAGAAGLALAAMPRPVAVRLSPAAYEIGGSRLTAAAPGVYRGPRGATVVVTRSAGATRAGASAVLDGVPTTGSCVLPDPGLTESCRFTAGGRSLAATDRWQGGGWARRYSDGRTVEITVAGGRPVPVPLPVGR